jgi:hypothetical protein
VCLDIFASFTKFWIDILQGMGIIRVICWLNKAFVFNIGGHNFSIKEKLVQMFLLDPSKSNAANPALMIFLLVAQTQSG